MFKRFFDLVMNNMNVMGVAFICFMFQVTILLLSFLHSVERMGSDTNFVAFHLFLVTFIPIVLSAMIFLLDKLIGIFIDYIHDGDIVCEHFIKAKLYGEGVFYWGVNEKLNAFVLTSVLLYLLLFMIFLLIYYPNILIVMGCIFFILFMFYGFAYLCRLVVRTNKKLNRHIKDSGVSHGN